MTRSFLERIGGPRVLLIIIMMMPLIILELLYLYFWMTS